MTLRDLMIERIRFCLTEADLKEDFGHTFEDLELLPVEIFLDLYDTMFTFQG